MTEQALSQSSLITHGSPRQELPASIKERARGGDLCSQKER